MRLIGGEKLEEGDAVRLKRTGEAGRIVHVFSVHPFNKGESWCWWGSAESFAGLTSWRRGDLYDAHG